MTAKTVLVVDDEPDIRDAVTILLRDMLDLDVVTAPSGAAGLQALSGLGDKVCLIVSDYRMPGMDGLEFLAKAQELRPDVPRVLMTAFADTDLAVRAINEARIARFVPKPLEPAAMEAMVREILSQHESERQRAAAFQRSLDVLNRKPDT